MLSKVAAQPGNEIISAHMCNKLLQYRCALGIGNAIEIGAHSIQIFHLGGNRVGSRELIYAISPVLS